jgi:hypothetical protein
LISGLTGRVFVGQRKDPFVVNLGEVFDLAVPSAEPSGNSHGAHNVTAFAMEVPIPFLTNNGANPIIGIWTTASRPQTRTLNLSPTSAGDAVLPPSPAEPLVQTSRLGMPLVNKLLIGLSAKDRFNNSHPSDDAVLFGQSFTNPAIAEIMGAPSAFRTDLQLFILTGLPGVNETGGVGDMLRLDTSVAPVPPEAQDPMGLLASPPDLAGFPNGRRPGDDAVDITLQVVQGILLGGPGPFDASDGVSPDPTAFLPTFPFLQVPGATDQDITCVTLQSSTSPERSTFEPVEEAFVDPHRSNRIDTPLTDDPLAYYLLEGNPPGSPAKIESLLHSAGRLQVVVAGSCM